MKITYKNGHWLYPDGTKFTNNERPPDPVWCSKDGIIRLIDYDDKNDANELIQRLERILYGKWV